jgi:two-component system chemotaxis response regulator CheB
MAKIKVLVIDDSALVRQVLTEIINKDPEFEVVGAAQDPLIAREKIKQLHPDVLTLDVEMPRMDGVTFLRNLMRLHPMPVLMVSTLTEQGADITLEALELGAVDFITKPKIDVAQQLNAYADELLAKVARGGARAGTALGGSCLWAYHGAKIERGCGARQAGSQIHHAAYHRPDHCNKRLHQWHGGHP